MNPFERGEKRAPQPESGRGTEEVSGVRRRPKERQEPQEHHPEGQAGLEKEVEELKRRRAELAGFSGLTLRIEDFVHAGALEVIKEYGTRKFMDAVKDVMLLGDRSKIYSDQMGEVVRHLEPDKKKRKKLLDTMLQNVDQEIKENKMLIEKDGYYDRDGDYDRGLKSNRLNISYDSLSVYQLQDKPIARKFLSTHLMGDGAMRMLWRTDFALWEDITHELEAHALNFDVLEKDRRKEYRRGRDALDGRMIQVAQRIEQEIERIREEIDSSRIMEESRIRREIIAILEEEQDEKKLAILVGPKLKELSELREGAKLEAIKKTERLSELLTRLGIRRQERGAG